MEELQWHEPPAYRRAVARRRDRDRPWEPFKVAATVFGAIIAVRGFAGFARPDGSPIGWPATVALAVVVALFLAFGFPRLLLLFPNSIVILSKRGINNNIIGMGASIRFWPWETISSCRIATVTLEGREFLTFRLHDREGQEMEAFGLRDKPAIEEIEGLLLKHGKPLEVDPA